MVKSSKTFIAIVVLAMLFTALLIVVREYTVETTRHLSQDITTRLAEVSLRVADDFEHSIDNKLTELQGITGFLAKEDCLPRKDCVLHYAPLLRAAGLKRFAIINPDGRGFCSMTGLPIDIEQNSKKSLFERALAGTANIAAVPDGKGSKLAVALPIQRNKEIVAVLIGELEDEPMKKACLPGHLAIKPVTWFSTATGACCSRPRRRAVWTGCFRKWRKKGCPPHCVNTC